MYKIIKDGATVGLTGAPNYIKKLDNGCYGLCSEQEAQGVAFNGVPYQLADRAEMGGLEAVTVAEVNEIDVTSDHLAAAQVFVKQAEIGIIDDNTALQHKGLFEVWRAGAECAVGSMRQYGEKLYKCLQAHTTQSDWTPDATPALWVEIAAPNEYREIKDNMLPTEAFALGEIGWYKEKDNLWKSLIPAITYTPETYPSGWEQVTG